MRALPSIIYSSIFGSICSRVSTTLTIHTLSRTTQSLRTSSHNTSLPAQTTTYLVFHPFCFSIVLDGGLDDPLEEQISLSRHISGQHCLDTIDSQSRFQVAWLFEHTNYRTGASHVLLVYELDFASPSSKKLEHCAMSRVPRGTGALNPETSQDSAEDAQHWPEDLISVRIEVDEALKGTPAMQKRKGLPPSSLW